MIVVNLNKAKTIAHDLRRQAREKEFQPLDDLIVKQIPGKSFAEIEAERQVIRDKYALLQTQMDNATTVEELRSFVPGV